MAAFGRDHKELDSIALRVLSDVSSYPENLAIWCNTWKGWRDHQRTNVTNLIPYRDILRRRVQLRRANPELRKRTSAHILNGYLRKEFPGRYNNDFHAASKALKIDNGLLFAAIKLSALWNIYLAEREEFRALQRFIGICSAEESERSRLLLGVTDDEALAIMIKYPHFQFVSPQDVANVLAYRLGL